MPQYLVAKSRVANGQFEVHLVTCECIPSPHRHHLGLFPSVARAVEEARKLYPRSQACAHCCPAVACNPTPVPFVQARANAMHA